jgi:hypothetical protein
VSDEDDKDTVLGEFKQLMKPYNRADIVLGELIKTVEDFDPVKLQRQFNREYNFEEAKEEILSFIGKLEDIYESFENCEEWEE